MEGKAERLCDKYLPQILQYVCFRVNHTEKAEELTLKIFQNFLAGYGIHSEQENTGVVRMFASARNEVLEYLKSAPSRTRFPGLSPLEQDIISLKLGAALNNQSIAEILGISESRIGQAVHQSLRKLGDRPEAQG